MTTTKARQRLTLTLLAVTTILAASACGTAGTGTTPTAASPGTASSGTASSSASMDPGMGGSSMGSTSSGSTAMADTTIHIKSFAYSGPADVAAGAMITVMNMDTEAHTVTADNGSFNVVVKPGTSAMFTAPAKPGSYAYHCTYHSNMHGTLTVK
ncbi:cupredoxin domain-containing protein [Arthrobacter sp. fls2-241-R2A-200]|uniref:cupredoxin domain-containing protein n=1 Tax=Arthrobacter sp. fls2-241-R2A-200 TaxID=3040281 RepID=UPI00254AB9D7|nr:cupredoxin domain-containing protein [Arthrobacter sp. fls2-241-R2A-200]